MADSQFSRPALPALINRQRTDLLSRLGQDDELRRADAEVYARVQAEGLNGLYGYLDWQARQYLPDLADQAGVERWANMFGLWYAAATAARAGRRASRMGRFTNAASRASAASAHHIHS